MFETGELILYGGTGVCRVEEIASMDGDRLYYVLQPLYQSCTITVPTDSTRVFMRPILTRQEAEDLIDRMPDIPGEAFHSPVMRQLSEHYESSLKSNDCDRWVELTKSLYEKRRTMQEQNRKFGALDEQFMKRAEDQLYGELGAALGIARDEVQDYIASRIQ